MVLLFQLNLPSAPDVCGSFVSESGNRLTTENGDALVTECSAPEAVILRPGRVYKSQYPYWLDRRKPYWETDEIDDEEIAIVISSYLG